jgi:L-fuculose-phosphate aldolase
MKCQQTDSESEIIEHILETGRQMWDRGLVAANDGNISVRTGDNELLTTATGVSKGNMTPEMILKVDMDGNVLSENGGYRPSSEVKMHIQAYRQREDVGAVVHAHPPFCTGFAVAGIPLDRLILPEAVLNLGAVYIAPYGTPSTREIPESIRPFIENSDAVLLANHGALTLGADLKAACFRMETLEHVAQIYHRAIQLGNVNPIPREQVEKLVVLRKRMNIPGRIAIPSPVDVEGG